MDDAMSFTSASVRSSITASVASWPVTWSMMMWPVASLSMRKSSVSALGTESRCSASCSLSRTSASLYRCSSQLVTPYRASRRISCTATVVASRQSFASDTTVSVDTAQPSRPLSLWSNSIRLKHGASLW